MPEVPEIVLKALTKSKVAWLVLPDGPTAAVWYAGAAESKVDAAAPAQEPPLRPDAPRAYVVGGPGEQQIPHLPAVLQVILRDKDTRAAVGPVDAEAHVLTPGSDAWEEAATALLAARQNTPAGDVRARWAAECTLWAVLICSAPPAVLGPDPHRAPTVDG